MAEVKSKRSADEFLRKSSVEAWAAKGIGKPQTAVDGFVEMFSALLYKEGCEVPTTELERWLDAYYQLRVAAEKQYDAAKFMAEHSGDFEPVVPKVEVKKARRNGFDFPDGLFWIPLLALLFGGGPASHPCMCGDEVKDRDEKEEPRPDKDEGKDEFYALSPMGKAFAQHIAKAFKSEVEQAGEARHCCKKDGHVAGDFIYPHESEK